MKRMIRASRNSKDDRLIRLAQDVEKHYNEAQFSDTPQAWNEYRKWLNATATKFGGAFRDGDHLEQWAFDYSDNFQSLSKDYRL